MEEGYEEEKSPIQSQNYEEQKHTEGESEANNDMQEELYDDGEGDYERGEGVNALNLEFVRGYNKDIKDGVHNLTNGERKAIFYSAAHTGVIYDYEEGEQKLLQGHCNKITCTACSADKRLIVTADSGIDSMLVLWDSYDGIPIRTYFNPYENGICALDISQDGRYLATISDDKFQAVSIWDLQNEELDEPIITTLCGYARDDKQYLIKFNPSDAYELVCHGESQLAFLSWSEDSDEIEYYLSPIQQSSFSKKEKKNAAFTSTVFIPDSTKAVTSTEKGDLLVWDISLIVDGMSHTNEKRLTKVLELHQDETSINTLTIHGDYLVTGNEDGSVRFYDFDLKICGWFENLDLGVIKSISFADEEPKSVDHEEEAEEELKCADFIVADSNAVVCKLESRLFEELEPDQKKGEVIFTGLKSAINCIAVHPHEPILAIGGKSGFLITWNYTTKEEEYKQLKEEPCAIEYSPDGKYLMGGTADGLIRIYDPYNDMVELQAPCKTSERSDHAIKQLIVSNDSEHFATMDVNNCVCLFKRDHKYGDPNEPIEWVFYGKVRSHEIEITSIAFGESLDTNDETQLRLFSIGKDRILFEYDVRKSSERNGLVIDNSRTMMIEQENVPTACIWYPTVDSKEDLLLTVNDVYKMKIWNVKSSQCRKTWLGPTYGGDISRLKKLEIDGNPDKFLAYSTFEKVIGLIKLPLDGNPTKTMGLIAHPNKVADMWVTSDGKYLFTCGGADLWVNKWSIDVTPIDNAIMMGGEGTEPFINLIEGGRDGQTFQDMKDFFYYSMVKSKTEGEDTTKTRKLDGKVSINQLGNLMRAMGHYPTLKEIENMMNEVEFAHFSENCEKVDRFDLDTFVKLFVNHRPVFGIGRPHIEKAFNTLFVDAKKNQPLDKVPREQFLQELASEGEPLMNQELGDLLDKLVGKPNIKEALGENIWPETFAKDILSFEEVEEDEDDEEGDYDPAYQEDNPNSTFAQDVIPEENIN